MVFIAGNIPYKTEITPLLIVIRLTEFDYSGATAIATVMLALSLPDVPPTINHHPGLGMAEVRPCLIRHRVRSRRCAAAAAGARRPRNREPPRSCSIAAAMFFLALFLLVPLVVGVRRGVAARACAAFLKGSAIPTPSRPSS